MCGMCSFAVCALIFIRSYVKTIIDSFVFFLLLRLTRLPFFVFDALASPWLGFKNIFYFALHNTKRECEWECVIKPAVILPFTRLFIHSLILLFFFCTFKFHFTIWSTPLSSLSMTTRQRWSRLFLHVQSFSLHVVYFVRISVFFFDFVSWSASLQCVVVHMYKLHSRG